MKRIIGVLVIVLAVVAWLVAMWLGDYWWQLAATGGFVLVVMAVLLVSDALDE